MYPKNGDEKVVTKNMYIQKTLEKLGLSKKEAAVYLASLQLGDGNLSEIAKAAQIPRTSCYNIVKSLISMGLLNTFKMGAKYHYKAENPDKLLISLREQESALQEIMPRLKSKYREIGGRPAIYFYEGVEGIRIILEDILAKQYPLLAITSIDDAVSVLGDDFTDFIERRHQKHLRVKLITHRSERALELKKRDESELRQTKFLPSNSQFKTASFIYGDRVAMIDFQSKQPLGLIIEDQNIAETQRMLFETIWKQIGG